jgi:hypothetical protein
MYTPWPCQSHSLTIKDDWLYSLLGNGLAVTGNRERRGMRRGMSPGALIGMMCATVVVLFSSVIVAATHRRSSPALPTAVADPNHASATQAAPTLSLATLNKAVNQPFFFIDALNTTPLLVPPPIPMKIATGGTITITGWAVDTIAGKGAGGVIVVVDDATTFQAAYGIDRPDVAATLKNDAYRQCGFSATVPSVRRSPGGQTISIKMIAADLRSYYAPGQEIGIEVGYVRGMLGLSR